MQFFLPNMSDTIRYIDEYEIKLAIINCIIIAILSIRNIVIMIKDHKITKKIILYILSLIYGFIYLLTFVDEDYILGCILATITLCIIMQNIYTYISDKDEKYVKKTGLIIQLISILMMAIVTIYWLIVFSSNIIQYTKNTIASYKYGTTLKENIDKLYEENTANKLCIPVCKDNKWGYIDDKGQEIIPCMYDEATEFYKMNYKTILNGKKSYLNIQAAMVKENNIYKVIGTEGQTLAESVGRAVPWKVDEQNIYEGINEVQKLDNIRRVDQVENENVNYNENGDIQLSDNVTLKAKKNDDGITYDLTVEILLENNGISRYSIENVIYFPDITYSDGSIPFYDYEKSMQGWIDKKGKERVLYSSLDKHIIVDINENNTIYKHKSNNSYAFFVNDNALGITDIIVTKKGYILKNKEKVIYADYNLKQKGDIYECIDETYINNDLLIVKKDNKYSVMNTEGEIITSKQYDMIKGYRTMCEKENYKMTFAEELYYNSYIEE